MDETAVTGGDRLSDRDLEEALIAFHRSVSAAQIYPPNHPMLLEALKDGYDAWARAQVDERWKSPGLQLRSGALWLGDQCLGRGSPAVSSLVRSFESRGLLGLRRTGQCQLEAYVRLVSLLTTAPDVLEREGGIAKAWNTGPWASALELRGLVVSAEAPSAEEGPARARGTDWGAGLPGADEISALADPLLQSRLQSFQRKGPQERRVLDLLLRLGRIEDSASFLQLLHEIVSIAERYLEVERCREAFHIVLYLYREAQNMDALGKVEKREHLLDSVRRTVLGGMLPWLIEQVATARGDEDAEVGEYILRFLGGAAIVPLLNALVAEKSRIGRRRLLNVVVSVGEPAVPSALKLLEDQRWYVVRNMVTVLGGIGSAEGLKAVARLSGDPDSRIRKEVARVIGRPDWVDQPDATSSLLRLLADTDASVRFVAVSAASHSKQKPVLEALWSHFRRTRISSRGWEFKAPLLRAIGQMGLAEAVPLLASVARKRPLLWPRRWERVQCAAVEALGDLGEAASKALARLREPKGPEARRAMARALALSGNRVEKGSA